MSVQEDVLMRNVFGGDFLLHCRNFYTEIKVNLKYKSEIQCKYFNRALFSE